jgi:hypothetical protein
MSSVRPLTADEIGEQATRFLPEFIRLPRNGLCPWTQLSRSKMAQLVLPCKENDYRPPVRSVCLRKVGAQKGARLIPLRELLDYLRGKLEFAAPSGDPEELRRQATELQAHARETAQSAIDSMLCRRHCSCWRQYLHSPLFCRQGTVTARRKSGNFFARRTCGKPDSRTKTLMPSAINAGGSLRSGTIDSALACLER